MLLLLLLPCRHPNPTHSVVCNDFCMELQIRVLLVLVSMRFDSNFDCVLISLSMMVLCV